ncbi:MAG: hypothetical protein KGI51_12145, partial [Rhodospirillales bacterium]|nr:hypothetical protein [Rhodospirillales bacterium]
MCALFALGGCKLVDQTTFAAAPPPMAPVPAAPPATDARRALVAIGPDATAAEYGPVLRVAVRAAERRDGRVRFDVTAIAPPAPAREATAAERQALAV